MSVNITAAQALSMGADAVVFSERPLPQAPTGYYDWEVSSDPAAGRKGHSLVSNLVSEVEAFKAKGPIKPDPKIVVSLISTIDYPIPHLFTKAAFADTVEHPTAVDDRKGAVSLIQVANTSID